MTVLSRWMQDGFSYCHLNPIFWEQLLDLPARQYHYDGHKASPTHRGVENGFQFLGKSQMYMWYAMINVLKKIVNAIIIFDTFVWGVCSVSLSFLYFLALSANVIFICDGQAHTCHEALHRNLHLFALKKRNTI